MAESPGHAHRLPEKVDGSRLIHIVGNAVPGVPQVLCTCKPYQMATFGGRNAEDGVPYARNSIRCVRKEPGTENGDDREGRPYARFPARRSEFHTPCPKVYKTAPKMDDGKRCQYRNWKIIAAKNMHCAQNSLRKRGFGTNDIKTGKNLYILTLP